MPIKTVVGRDFRPEVPCVNSDLSALVFRTRGLYIFIALMVSVALKFWSHGTTSASLFIAGVVIIVVALVVYFTRRRDF